MTYKPSKNKAETQGDKEALQDKANKEVENKDKDNIADAEMLMFKFKDMQHYYVLLFDDDKMDAIEIENKVKAFNDTNFADLNLKTTSTLFTITKQMIGVRKFSNRNLAMDYYQSIDTMLQAYDKDHYTHFVISIQNYPTFYKKKNIETYEKFFNLMYLEPLQRQEQQEGTTIQDNNQK